MASPMIETIPTEIETLQISTNRNALFDKMVEEAKSKLPPEDII